MLRTKKLLIITFFLTLFISEKAKSINLYEIFLVGIGAGLILDQRYDNSLEYSNEYALKDEILNKFYNSKKKKVSSTYFRDLPIQQKLLVLEEIEKF